MNLCSYPPDVPIVGLNAPSASQVDELLRLLLTVRDRYGNTAVSYHVRWGESSLQMEDEMARRVGELECALTESLKLQSHYAQLLNTYDSGERKTFPDVAAWLDRLRHLQEPHLQEPGNESTEAV